VEIIPLSKKNRSKHEREHRVLLGLVDYHLKTGKPVGSNVLKEAEFDELSAATIRNYFSNLEKEGYLTQQHISGGRIPTTKAFRFYVDAYADESEIDHETEHAFLGLRQTETREIAKYLAGAAESLSTLTRCAVFLSAPRFDKDYIVDVKIVPIDHARCLCVVITDFGVVHTELLPIDAKLRTLAAKRIEAYFHWRLTGLDKPENFDAEEEQVAQQIYNEVMIRYIVHYSHFLYPDIFRTGFSKLLDHPDLCDSSLLASSLSLFENTHNLRLLIKECCSAQTLKLWIGEELSQYSSSVPNSSILAIPYYTGQNIAGAVGLMGPVRIPYRKLFGILKYFSSNISEALTRNLYKFKMTYRQPESNNSDGYRLLLDQSRLLQLENKSPHKGVETQ
jgi:heat-inducible transcriptional repressor